MSIENKVPMSDFTEVTNISDNARIIGLQDNENVKIPLQSLIAKTLTRVDEDILTVNDINVDGGVTGFNPIGKVAEGDLRAVSGGEVLKNLDKYITFDINGLTTSPTLTKFFSYIKNIYIKVGDTFVDYRDIQVTYCWINNPNGNIKITKFGLQILVNGEYISCGFHRDSDIENLPINEVIMLNNEKDSNINVYVVLNKKIDNSDSFFTPFNKKPFKERALICNNILDFYKPTNVNKITATRNAQDYNSIRNLINSIVDASESNKYEIFVPNGEWFELDIQGKDFVKVVCESEKTIIYCDRRKTDAKYIVPNDFPYANERGKQINSVNSMFIHVIFITDNFEWENGTVKMIEGKYAAHIDSNKFKYANFKNVTFETITCIHPVGIGIWGGQTLNFENCTFKSEDSEYGVGTHNWNNQTKGTFQNYINCHFKGCATFKIDELGSNQKDIINVINCATDARKPLLYQAVSNNNVSYWKDVGGQTTNDPLLVPYCTFVNIIGTDIDWYLTTNSGWSSTTEYNRDYSKMLDNINSDYYTKYKLTENVEKGDLVSIVNYVNKNYSTIEKYKGVNSIGIIGVACEDGVSGDVIKVINNGKVSMAKVAGYVSGTPDKKLTFDTVLRSNKTANSWEVVGRLINVYKTNELYNVVIK